MLNFQQKFSELQMKWEEKWKKNSSNRFAASRQNPLLWDFVEINTQLSDEGEISLFAGKVLKSVGINELFVQIGNPPLFNWINLKKMWHTWKKVLKCQKSSQNKQ